MIIFMSSHSVVSTLKNSSSGSRTPRCWFGNHVRTTNERHYYHDGIHQHHYHDNSNPVMKCWYYYYYSIRTVVLFVLFWTVMNNYVTGQSLISNIATQTSSSSFASSVSLLPRQLQSNPNDNNVIRINCGASARIPVITPPDISWSKDSYYRSGTISNRCLLSNTTNSNNNQTGGSIYCTSRYFRSSTYGTPLRYDIPVPYNQASYQLRLHFNEQVRTDGT